MTGNMSGVYTNYIASATYWPHGQPNAYAYGNAVEPVFYYNDRLEMDATWDAVNNDQNKFLFYEPVTRANDGRVQKELPVRYDEMNP